jgi:hypothetical protein
MKAYIRNILYLLFAAALAGSVYGAHNKLTSGSGDFVVSSDEGSGKPPKLLHISALADGSEKIVFTTEGVHDEHLHWSPMSNVVFDGKPWTDLDQTPVSWLGSSDRLDLSKARIVKRAGRDVIALEPTAEGFDLYLVDSPNGASCYEVTISIPYRK